MEYHSALKIRKEILSWMKFHDIMLSEIRELQKKKTHSVRFHLHEVSRVVRLLRTESRKLVTKGWVEVGGELLFNDF